jgi:flagellar hook-basal body complex protein FliE
MSGMIAPLTGSPSAVVRQPPIAETASSGGSDFAAALASSARQAMETMRAAETVSMDGLAGRAPVQDVVEGVMAAERQFTAALAIRDKIVSAYLDLSRMQI